MGNGRMLVWPDFWCKIVKMYIKIYFLMSFIRHKTVVVVVVELKRHKTIFGMFLAGVGFFFIRYIKILLVIWRRSWRGQLWLHRVQLGLNIMKLQDLREMDGNVWYSWRNSPYFLLGGSFFHADFSYSHGQASHHKTKMQNALIGYPLLFRHFPKCLY